MLTPSSCRDWPQSGLFWRSRPAGPSDEGLGGLEGRGSPRSITRPCASLPLFPLIPMTPALTPPLGEFTGGSWSSPQLLHGLKVDCPLGIHPRGMLRLSTLTTSGQLCPASPSYDSRRLLQASSRTNFVVEPHTRDHEATGLQESGRGSSPLKARSPSDKPQPSQGAVAGGALEEGRLTGQEALGQP